MSVDTRPLVLIVDDDPGVAILQRRRLERAGFPVVVATDLDGALDALGRGGIGIVLLDYRLGETTGLDLHRRMRAGGYEVPVILVSGGMEDGSIVEALRAGIRDVVVKTTDYLDSLPDTVRAVLGQGGVAGGLAPLTPGGSRILVVEDEPGTAILERRRLERAGYAVDVATTVEEAHAIVRTGNVALALLDLRLSSDLSGLDLYEQWKAIGLSLPAILVTGFADQAVVIRALRMGIRDFVPKSHDFVEDLPTAVDRVMAQLRVERKLAESELRLASVIGTTLDAILMCDAAGRVVLCNQSAQQLFECPAADVLATPVATLIPGLRLDTAATPGQFRERGELHGVRRASGELTPIEVSVTDVVIQQQRLFTVIARDITERRRAEEERRDADRRKDEFLGMLGHELRNPLAAIMSAGEVLHRSLPEGRMQKLTGVVRRQTRALSRMVDDLLDISRVTLGKIELNRELLLVGPLVMRAVDGVREAAATAGLTVVTHVDAEPLWLDADPTRIEQVLTNLLTNAIKFTPAGGRITVTSGSEGAEAVVTVRDTGIGMPASLLPQVFDIFVQGDSSLDRSRSGLGIGLALVRQIVMMHDGTVTAESAGLDLGSAFTLRLPLAPREAQPLEDSLDTTPEPHFRLCVLVVDDQQDVADSVAALVESLGHGVRTAYDAAAALTLARQERPDVIIADIGMPGMSGYELAQCLRRDAALKQVQLVALTGYGRDEDHTRVVQAGFDRHLTKPVTETALHAALERSSDA